MVIGHCRRVIVVGIDNITLSKAEHASSTGVHVLEGKQAC